MENNFSVFVDDIKKYHIGDTISCMIVVFDGNYMLKLNIGKADTVFDENGEDASKVLKALDERYSDEVDITVTGISTNTKELAFRFDCMDKECRLIRSRFDYIPILDNGKGQKLECHTKQDCDESQEETTFSLSELSATLNCEPWISLNNFAEHNDPLCIIELIKGKATSSKRWEIVANVSVQKLVGTEEKSFAASKKAKLIKDAAMAYCGVKDDDDDSYKDMAIKMISLLKFTKYENERGCAND